MVVDAYTDYGAAGILLYITRVRSTSDAPFTFTRRACSQPHA